MRHPLYLAANRCRGFSIFLAAYFLYVGTGYAFSVSEEGAEVRAGVFWSSDMEEAGQETQVGVGMASWYGGKFHGRKTASGERYNKGALTCASPTLPFGTILEVTNLENGKTAVVRVNDRGPYRKKRILDVSRAVAELLGFRHLGVTQVSYRIIETPP
jgi:rare lipoprotein A (peptidoglycan hydrolase)